LTRDRIVAALGRSRQFVDEWVARYRKCGVGALPVRSNGGHA
jgi:hypothetical protein